jgi:hypothetical protein
VATPVPQSVVADPAALNEQGLALYRSGDYRHALEKFIEAHALDADPNALFNIGRCYEQLGQRDAALEKYELFLAAPGVDPAGVERAQASMAALRALSSEPPPEKPAAAPSPPVHASYAPWVPWVTLGGGALFVAAGATVYALGMRDHARVTDLPAYGQPDVPVGMTWKRAHALVRAGDTKKLVGAMGLGLGGAALATASALFLFRDGPVQHEPSIAVEPSALPGGGGVLLAGTFQ